MRFAIYARLRDTVNINFLKPRPGPRDVWLYKALWPGLLNTQQALTQQALARNIEIGPAAAEVQEQICLSLAATELQKQTCVSHCFERPEAGSRQQRVREPERVRPDCREACRRPDVASCSAYEDGHTTSPKPSALPLRARPSPVASRSCPARASAHHSRSP